MNAGEQVGSAAKDAVSAVTSLLTNPVGALQAGYNALGPARAQAAGAALCVMFAIIAPLGVLINGPDVFALLGLGLGLYAESNFGIFIRVVLAMLILAAAMIAASLGVRKVASSQAPIAADIYGVGAALTPLGLGMFLSSFLHGSPELGMLLMVFASCYVVLILFAAFTRIGGVSEKIAAPGVPAVFVVSLYICKVILGAMTGGPNGL
ncbi:MAG TPA: hypothetical protein VFV78_04580 [Vicinamibacterales bacterium]|nr:hypothetical protein [Vicinamibacterales bacterium]